MPFTFNAGAIAASPSFTANALSARLGVGDVTLVDRFRPELTTVGFPFPQPQPLPFPFPFPQPVPHPQPQPPSPTASASDLQVLIASIPVAQEGHLIQSDYHNALRNALVAIANRMGLGTIAEEITVSAAPAFTFKGAIRGWEMDYGIARKPAGTAAGSSVHGWLELDLPDGARIKKMVVFGKNVSSTGTATTAVLKVQLRRQKITDPSVSATLIEVTLGDDALRGKEGDVTLPGTGAGTGAIDEFRLVNNREQKYLLTAELDTIDDNTSAQINAIQIVCGR